MLAAGLALAPAVAASFPPGEGGAPGTVTASFSQSTACNINTSQAGTATQPLVLTVDVSTLAAKGPLETLFVAVPSGYTNVTVASVMPSGTPSVLTVGSTAHVRIGGLKLGIGSSVTVTVNATLPWGATSAPATWAIEGETGNDAKPDLDKPDGDDYYAPTLPATTVAENCTLAFAPGPADAGANLNITSVALTQTGAAVAVSVTDSNGVVLTPTITLLLAPISVDGEPATPPALSGLVTEPTTSGVATFPTLSVNDPGSYTLTATASMAGFTPSPLTSSSFRIWGAAAACGSTGCVVPTLTGSGGENVNVGSGSTAGAIGASLDILPSSITFDCSAPAYGGVAGIPGTDTVTWTSNGLAAGKTLQLSIPDALLSPTNTFGPFDPLLAAHYMVCVSAPYAFPVAWTPASLTNGSNGYASPDSAVSMVMNGTTTGWYRGLLPDCQDVSVDNVSSPALSHAPCVASRVHGASGLTVTVWAAAGDPFGR
jgi:hypothetical protein